MSDEGRICLTTNSDSALPNKKDFEPTVIDEIYEKELAEVNTQRVMLLELSHYLEKYPLLTQVKSGNND
jgi:hypothetical protein